MASRRPNGSGSIRKVSENKWVASIYLGVKPNGKPQIKQFSAKTKSEVTRKLNEFKKNQGFEQTAQLVKRTVSDYFEFWLNIKKTQLKDLSYRRLESTYNTYIKPELGYLQFATVRTEDIQQLIDKCYFTKSHSTVKKIFNALNAIYKYDLALPPRQRIASYNPCTNIVVKNKEVKEKQPVKIFSDTELNLIKTEIYRTDEKTGMPIYPYGALYVFILNTGLRLGEALALEKADIDFNTKTAKITKNLIQLKNDNGKGYGVKIQDSLKTSSGYRTIYLNEAAIISLKQLYELFPDTPYMALNRNGKRVTPQNGEKTFKNILECCKIERDGRACHALRHTFATKMFEAGQNIKRISHMLGHSSVSVTYDIYVSVIQRVEAESMNSMPSI